MISSHARHIKNKRKLVVLQVRNIAKQTWKENHFNCSAVEAKARNVLQNIQRENLFASFRRKWHTQAFFVGLMLALHYEVKFEV